MSFLKKTKRLLRLIVSLKNGTDAEGTIREITKNVSLRGVNVWMLVCSAILASIGLDVNSTAVIIGAMLISPLMSPILGVGLAIAIQDRKLLNNSLRNLGLATFLSLLTSFLYFLISPLGEATSEITARTTPTVLDVGIAFFGGIAGIVAGSRRDKTNALPGVAIATALMPPICVAGFGLAKMSLTVFLGAFYLFFINAVFIAFATYFISISLHFPKKEQINEEQKAIVRRLIIAFVILVIVPSGLVFYNVLSKLRFSRGIKSFVNTEIRRDERQPVQFEMVDSTMPRTLKVYTVGKAVSDEEKKSLQASLSNYGIGDLKLDIVQLNVSPDEFARLTSDVESNLGNKVKLLQSIEEERKIEVEELQNEVKNLRENAVPDKLFLNNIRDLFPEIVNLAWQDSTTENGGATSNQVRTLLVEFQKDITEAAKKTINAKILRLAQAQLRDDNFSIIEQKNESRENIEGSENNADTK